MASPCGWVANIMRRSARPRRPFTGNPNLETMFVVVLASRPRRRTRRGSARPFARRGRRPGWLESCRNSSIPVWLRSSMPVDTWAQVWHRWPTTKQGMLLSVNRQRQTPLEAHRGHAFGGCRYLKVISCGAHSFSKSLHMSLARSDLFGGKPLEY